jgi:CheY-like chemotaxis protein
MTTILLVEDNAHKRDRTHAFLTETFPNAVIEVASSYTSACRYVAQQVFDVIVMDMSLPTFDKSASESGGRFRTFGGREVARKVVRRSAGSKIVFLTQYPTFRDDVRSVTLSALGDELAEECGNQYVGIVHYDSSKSQWKDDLAKLISGIE